MRFTGRYEHTIDAKNRLAVPSEIRDLVKEHGEGEVWYALPWRKENLLRVYTEQAFDELAANWPQSLIPDPVEAELGATLFGFAARMEIDSAGRVRFPEDYLGLVGLNKEVIIIGAGNCLEIRDRAKWRQQEIQRLEDMAAQAAKVNARKHAGQ